MATNNPPENSTSKLTYPIVFLIIGVGALILFGIGMCKNDTKSIKTTLPGSSIEVQNVSQIETILVDSISKLQGRLQELDKQIKQNQYLRDSLIVLKNQFELSKNRGETLLNRLKSASGLANKDLMNDITDFLSRGGKVTIEDAIASYRTGSTSQSQSPTTTTVDAYQILKDNYDRLLVEVKELRKENSTIKSELTNYKAKYRDANNQLSSLRVNFALANKQIGSLETQLSNLNGQLTNFKKDSVTFSSNIDKLNEEIKNTTNDKEELQKEMSKAVAESKLTKKFSISNFEFKPIEVARRSDEEATYKTKFSSIQLKFRLLANSQSSTGQNKELKVVYRIPLTEVGVDKIIERKYTVLVGKDNVFTLDVSNIAKAEGLYTVQIFDEDIDIKLPIYMGNFPVKKVRGMFGREK